MDAALALLRSSPATTGLFLDFDGTLAPIQATAEEAQPLPGVAELLLQLEDAYGVVAIVSGRPVSYLIDHLPGGLELHGLYGLEGFVGGEVVHHAEALAYREVVADVVEAAHTSGPSGIDVEDKGLSLTLHFRRRPDQSEAVHTWATAAAERSGLAMRSAKMSIELHPPVAVDKGTVVEDRAAGLSAAAYLGDDHGDLPAFAALDRLAGQGLTTLKVAVHTPDASPELLAQADLHVEGPDGAVDLLRALL